MGSCVSKTPEPASKQSQSLKARTEKPSQAQDGDSRQAAARAAEQRYKEQQEKNQSSHAQLKAMQKVSRKDKGLA